MKVLRSGMEGRKRMMAYASVHRYFYNRHFLRASVTICAAIALTSVISQATV